MERRVFGPVPSRRLGKSLGVNNIPFKVCTDTCKYCQLGKGIRMQVTRQEFFKPEDLTEEVKQILDKTRGSDDYPDYITIVPDGEPTLDINLGKLIESLRSLRVPVAVITNSSLIHLPDVREELLKTDYVSVKADTFKTETWKNLNIPHKSLDLDSISQGIISFARQFKGKLVTETMLVHGINDSLDELENTARMVGLIKPDTAFIAIPTRPPAFSGVLPADEATVIEAYNIFKRIIDKVELLTGYEGNEFSSTGNFREDLLSITAVHPMRENAVMELLQKTNDREELLASMVDEGVVKQASYGGHTYYLRKFRR